MVHEAVFGFKKAGLKLGVTMRGSRFMQSVGLSCHTHITYMIMYNAGHNSFNILIANQLIVMWAQDLKKIKIKIEMHTTQ